MNAAAIGIRVHSGWGALVAVAAQNGTQEILERRKIVIIDPAAKGVNQPYHYVEEMELAAAERHIAKCAVESRRLAQQELESVISALRGRGFRVTGSAILLSSARPLPDLDEILSSHALIHTAEGEFFRHAFRTALERLEVPVTGIRESELDEHAKKHFGAVASETRKRIDAMGRALGPPWTLDEKSAAMAAAIVLAQHCPKPESP
jgi:hypothetical protein